MLNIALLETAIIMAISGCAELQKKTTQQEKESTTMVTDTVNTESGNYYETYEGILPCADCGGIRTTQKINSDTIYQLWSEYLGKKNGVFEEISICNMLNCRTILQETQDKGKMVCSIDSRRKICSLG